ncbi:MAG: hypothetical protein WAJ96_14460 [Candidatus Acidiferrum sp.]
MDFSGQTIIDYNIPDLFDLIGLAFIAKRLKVENLNYSAAEEDVVTTFDAFLKSKELQKLDHSGERNVGVGIRAEDSLKQFVSTRHGCERNESVPQ